MLFHFLMLYLTRFNTSHVVVYPGAGYFKEEKELSFNTSHVVVYLLANSVSKYNPYLFQYISCCSLSYM